MCLYLREQLSVSWYLFSSCLLLFIVRRLPCKFEQFACIAKNYIRIFENLSLVSRTATYFVKKPRLTIHILLFYKLPSITFKRLKQDSATFCTTHIVRDYADCVCPWVLAPWQATKFSFCSSLQGVCKYIRNDEWVSEGDEKRQRVSSIYKQYRKKIGTYR